jgi:DNA repair photolyase
MSDESQVPEERLPPHVLPKGRGAGENPANRFASSHYQPDAEAVAAAVEEEGGAVGPSTRFYPDTTSSIISRNSSPDVGFTASLNPYRGCEHGCSYCYARPTHEYLGFSSGLDFESKIMVKERAAELLREELSSPKWKVEILAMSGVTDCYQPVERRLEITRQCLSVLVEFRQPVGIITKNALVARDIDLLQPLAAVGAVSVCLSITSLDAELARRLEPRASSPRARLEAVRQLRAAGVPVGVNIAPVIPGLNDHEIPAILEAAAEAGAQFSGYGMLRLPYAVKDLFEAWLEATVPSKKDKVLDRIRSVRGGKLNDSKFGSRMRGEGIFAKQIRLLFKTSARRNGLDCPWPELSQAAFRRPGGKQMELFG